MPFIETFLCSEYLHVSSHVLPQPFERDDDDVLMLQVRTPRQLAQVGSGRAGIKAENVLEPCSPLLGSSSGAFTLLPEALLGFSGSWGPWVQS